jgi:hypothetical protein
MRELLPETECGRDYEIAHKVSGFSDWIGSTSALPLLGFSWIPVVVVSRLPSALLFLTASFRLSLAEAFCLFTFLTLTPFLVVLVHVFPLSFSLFGPAGIKWVVGRLLVTWSTGLDVGEFRLPELSFTRFPNAAFFSFEDFLFALFFSHRDIPPIDHLARTTNHKAASTNKNADAHFR